MIIRKEGDMCDIPHHHIPIASNHYAEGVSQCHIVMSTDLVSDQASVLRHDVTCIKHEYPQTRMSDALSWVMESPLEESSLGNQGWIPRGK